MTKVITKLKSYDLFTDAVSVQYSRQTRRSSDEGAFAAGGSRRESPGSKRTNSNENSGHCCPLRDAGLSDQFQGV